MKAVENGTPMREKRMPTCGCKVMGDVNGVWMEYCPLHEAGDIMLLKFGEAFSAPDYQAMSNIRFAIASAEGTACAGAFKSP